MEELLKWIEVNKINIGVEPTFKDNKFIIEGVGTFLLVIEKEDGKIFDEEFKLILNAFELSQKVDYYVFNFGGKFFYSSKHKKVELNLFKYLGKAKIDIELPFVHLGVRGRFEILNGSRDYEDWCKKANFLNIPSLGICEKNTLGGIIHFQLACTKAKIKPIFGETITIKTNDDSFLDCKLFTLNEQGWKNLLRINKFINIINDKFIEISNLEKLGKGLILILPNDCVKHKLDIKTLQNKFEGVYYQIDTVEWSNEKTDVDYLTNIKFYLEKLSSYLPPILINDSFYLDKEEFYIKKILNKIGDVKLQKDSEGQYFKSVDDSFEIFSALFKDEDDRLYSLFEEAVNNTIVLSEESDFKLKIGDFKLPTFNFNGLPKPYSDFKSNRELYDYIVQEGLDEILGNNKIKKSDLPKYLERIEIENKVIVKGNFIDYFLILWDICRWCKANNILVGLGRGSAAGSLISYLLDITKLDPIQYDLLFHRFLNEGRIGKSLPDIDLDFPTLKRDTVLSYIKNKYGENYVCSVGSYTNLKIISGIKDLARLKGLNYDSYNYLTTNLMKFKENSDGDWEELFILAQKVPAVKDFIQNNYQLVQDLYLILNQTKAVSVHPCATIVLPFYENEDIYDFIPMRKDDNGNIISEWEGPELDAIGYLKEDILGLRQLDKFEFILNLIKENKGEIIDIYNLPQNDERVMELFKQGYNSDVFQFGSPGLTKYSLQVKPDNLEDLTNMVALFRPGPIGAGAHFNYVQFKFKTKQPEYDFGLKEVTLSTYGLYIFQEQVMKACQILGGFNDVETDDIRKALGKKIASILIPYEKRFIDNAISKGCSEEIAKAIWVKLEYFSGYGFNRSHASVYASTGYISQYLKYYHPLEFWTSAFQFVDKAKKEKLILKYIGEIYRINEEVKIIPPDVNNSTNDFTTNFKNWKIYWSLEGIKFLGEVGISALLEEREKNGKYFSLKEFIMRVPKDKVNKRMVINLIFSGSFDEIEEVKSPKDRKRLIEQYYIEAGINPKEEVLLSSPNIQYEWWWVLKQKELSGVGTLNYKSLIQQSKEMSIYAPIFVDAISLQDNSLVDKVISFGGIIKTLVVKKNKKGEQFAIITLDSNYEEINFLLWNDGWELYKDLLRDYQNKIILFLGVVKEDIYSGGEKNSIHFHSSKHRIELLGDSEEQRNIKKVKVVIEYKAGDIREFKDGPYKMTEEGKWKKVKQ